MTSITFSCKTITPMFLGGANPAEAELRAPSLKGALRFWWRAMNAENLHDEEKIFGAPNEEYGRSKVAISVAGDFPLILPSFGNQTGRIIQVSSKGKTFPVNILDYLAYGCHEYITGQGVKYYRSCLEPGTHFELTLRLFEDTYTDAILDSLTALIYFGGLGARSRNGYGKFWAEGLAPRYQNIKTRLLQGSLKPFTSGSNRGRLFETRGLLGTWDKALGEIGYHYRIARTSIDKRHFFSDRVLVSQPIIENKYNVTEMFLERHSKSLFLSVVPENGQFRGQILVLPYDYLANSRQSDVVPAKGKNLPLNAKQEYLRVYNSLIKNFEQNLTPVP